MLLQGTLLTCLTSDKLIDTQVVDVVNEIKIWFYPNVPECHATKCGKAN